jgi:hypothetical protein
MSPLSKEEGSKERISPHFLGRGFIGPDVPLFPGGGFRGRDVPSIEGGEFRGKGFPDDRRAVA